MVPLVQMTDGNYDSDRDEWILSVNVTNTGLGPAHIQTFQVFWNGNAISGDMTPLLLQCCVPDSVAPEERMRYVASAFQTGQLAFFFADVSGRYLAPQESVTIITSSRPDAETAPEGRQLWDALSIARRDIAYEVCYCSVFDDCWLASFPAQTRESVKACLVSE